MAKNNINIGTFNFINCLPVNYPLIKWNFENITLISDYPAKINQLIASQCLQVAPVSSAYYLDNLDKYSLIDTICISSDNEVGSVILFSKYKLEELENKTIGTPYTSFSSINLLKILLKEKEVNLEKINFESHKYEISLKEALNSKYDAILYIGDPALTANYNKQNLSEILVYDLGKLWKDLTDYPMVFATWVAQSDWKISNEDNFEWVSLLLDKAVNAGLNIYLDEIINLTSKNFNLDKMYLRDYFTKKLNYKFTQKHRESLQIFKELYSKLKV